MRIFTQDGLARKSAHLSIDARTQSQNHGREKSFRLSTYRRGPLKVIDVSGSFSKSAMSL
jgi:hypothetical protein